MEMRPNRRFVSPDEVFEQHLRERAKKQNRGKTSPSDVLSYEEWIKAGRPSGEEWLRREDARTKTRYPKKEAYRKRLAAQVEAIARHTLDDSLKSREAKLRTRRELLRKRKAK